MDEDGNDPITDEQVVAAKEEEDPNQEEGNASSDSDAAAVTVEKEEHNDDNDNADDDNEKDSQEIETHDPAPPAEPKEESTPAEKDEKEEEEKPETGVVATEEAIREPEAEDAKTEAATKSPSAALLQGDDDAAAAAEPKNNGGDNVASSDITGSSSTEATEGTSVEKSATATPPASPYTTPPASATVTPLALSSQEKAAGTHATIAQIPEAAPPSSPSSAPPAAKNNNSNNDDDDDDVTSKAAVALAAVAAAAVANHKSPAEAAAQARAVAQSFLTVGGDHSPRGGGVGSNGSGGGPQAVQPVRLADVKAHLRQKSLETGSTLTDKLCQGGNDAFLQHLLLLERFRCLADVDEDLDSIDVSSASELDQALNTSAAGNGETGTANERARVAAQAAERVVSVLKKMEGAYESLINMLPPSTRRTAAQQQQEDVLDDDQEMPVAAPDLLPPSTPPQGDATLSFFRACTTDIPVSGRGEGAVAAGEGTREATSRADEDAAMDAGQASDSLDKSPTTSSASAAADDTNTSSGGGGLLAAATGGRSMFGSMFRRSASADTTAVSSNVAATSSTAFATAAAAAKSTSGVGLLGSFRKKAAASRSSGTAKAEGGAAANTESATSLGGSPNSNGSTRPGEYCVKIEREMLGLTVENVLERTVVRTVLAGGPAKKAGARVGSLIVKVGNVDTQNLTHFETIDELRQSQRPLCLVLRQVSDEALRSAREEMGRLIRGSGFGIMTDSHRPVDAHGDEQQTNGNEAQKSPVRPLIGADLRIDAYTNIIRRRFAEAGPQVRNKKEEALVKIGEKLVWVLTLLVIGLEQEATRLFALAGSATNPTASPHRNSHSLYHHTAKDYADAARSVAKVLLDYTRKKLDPNPNKNKGGGGAKDAQGAAGNLRRRSKIPAPPPIPRGRRRPMVPGSGSAGESSMAHEKPLLQIGDVLQRTRTFLADITSPPAALLRGEVIAFLCDVLDIDTEMELSEEDAVSATVGAQAGPISDLGTAGSLLKLIVLNYANMQSPDIEDASVGDKKTLSPVVVAELQRRFGTRERFSADDMRRLCAGNRFLAVVHRLAASRSMSARITACSLGPVLWGHLDVPHQLQLRGVITRALHDVEVIVRKATANVLYEIAELVFDPRCVPWLVLMSERAMTDPEPQLRSAAMTLTWHLAEHLPNAFLGDASQGSRYLRRLPDRNDPIFADVYLLQCKLLPVATRLAEDRSPSVRLAVAAQCDRLCDVLGDHWSSVVIDVLLGLLSDSDERVRCEGVMCVPRLAEIVLLSTPPGETAVSEVSILEALVPASIRLQKDPSPSVRVSLAAAAGELLTLMVALQSRSDEAYSMGNGGDHAPSERSSDETATKQYKRLADERLIPLIQSLLNDPDPEVTSASLRAVTNASRKSSPAPSSRRHLHSIASEDDSLSVTSYHSHASREPTPRQPVFLPVLSEGQVLRLLPTLTELADSRQWRVRQSAVEIVPALLGCTQKLETRHEISKLCVRLMGDRVDAVRNTAAECLCLGGSSLGSHGLEDASTEWITSIVIPSIRNCAIHNDSKQRQLSLKMVQVMLVNGACPAKWKEAESDDAVPRMTDSPMRELVVIALSLTQDGIANVRLNVGRALEAVLHVFEEEELSFIKEVLTQQVVSEKERPGGGDMDVLFFAEKCVRRASVLLEERNDESGNVLS